MQKNQEKLKNAEKWKMNLKMMKNEKSFDQISSFKKQNPDYY